jgi:hypothetical protein
MRAIIFRRAVCVGAWVLLVCGGMAICENRALSAPLQTSDASSDFDNLEMVDASLNGKLVALRVGSERTSTNLLSVFVGLKNKTARILKIEVQTVYKDKEGNRLSMGTGSWIPLKLKPHEEMEYCSASISEDAVDFLVRVRREPDADTGGTK